MCSDCERRDDEFSLHAQSFLRSIGLTDLVLLAICADASYKMLLLISFHDTESAQVVCIAERVSESMRNLKELFGDSLACLTRSCFTQQRR